jgi:hypothetical protein
MSVRTKIAIWTIIAAVVVVGLGGYVSSNRSLTPLEASLFQVIQLAIAVTSSYLFAKNTNKQQVTQQIEERATLAVRRIMRMLSAYTILSNSIEQQRVFFRKQANARSEIKIDIVENSLDDLGNLIVSHYGSIADMADDWADVSSDEVKKLLRNKQRRDKNNG